MLSIRIDSDAPISRLPTPEGSPVEVAPDKKSFAVKADEVMMFTRVTDAATNHATVTAVGIDGVKNEPLNGRDLFETWVLIADAIEKDPHAPDPVRRLCGGVREVVSGNVAQRILELIDKLQSATPVDATGEKLDVDNGKGPDRTLNMVSGFGREPRRR